MRHLNSDKNQSRDQCELEQWARAHIENLPKIKAPQTFSKRVMAKILDEEQSIWWKRPFNEWNWFCRAGFAILCAVAGFVALRFIELIGNYYQFDLKPTRILETGGANIIFVLFSIIKTIVSSLEIILEQYRWELVILVLVSGVVYGLCVGLATVGVQLLTENKK
ncbi:MAG: hypothetical protein ACP5MG_10480 [Verrucomicrobiia bacterium]|jgi:hypothetical protein